MSPNNCTCVTLQQQLTKFNNINPNPPPPPPKHRFTIYLMRDELITPITQMHVHGIEFEKKTRV